MPPEDDVGFAQPWDASSWLWQVFGLLQHLRHGDPCSPAVLVHQGGIGLPCRSLFCPERPVLRKPISSSARSVAPV